MSSIQRLKKTWAKVNTEKFAVLEHQMNPAGNFTSYRASLKTALWRSEGAVDDREKVGCLLYLYPSHAHLFQFCDVIPPFET